MPEGSEKWKDLPSHGRRGGKYWVALPFSWTANVSCCCKCKGKHKMKEYKVLQIQVIKWCIFTCVLWWTFSSLCQTFSGNTALHIVSSLQNYRNQVEAVKLLVRNGADPGMRNLENELPCQLVPEGSVGEKVLTWTEAQIFQVYTTFQWHNTNTITIKDQPILSYYFCSL